MKSITRNTLAAAIATGILFGAAVLFTTGTSAQQVPAPPKPPVAVPTPPPLPEDDEGIIEIDTEVVNVLFTAQDRQRRLLTNLRDTDIRLLENGEPQDIVEFVRKIDLPLSLTILIDTSVSQERTLPEEKDAAKSFLESVVRPSKDEVAIISFTGEATLEQGMTGNVSRLRRAVDNVRFVPPSGYVGGGVVVGTPPISGGNQTTVGSTAIWDAVWVTAEEVLGPAPDGTRRAMILLTDGLSNYGLKKMEHAIEAALKAETVIYTIGIGDNFYGGVNEGALKKISESTGGSAFFPRDERELREAFQQIQEEMRSQYLIAYEPTNQARDGSYRKIEVQLVNPRLQKDKVKVTHREGYFAKTGNRK